MRERTPRLRRWCRAQRKRHRNDPECHLSPETSSTEITTPGIRFSGDAISQILVENTFVDNGVPSNGPNRSEINLDDGLREAIVRRNIFRCRANAREHAQDRSPSDNLVQETHKGSCVANTVVADPEFSDSGADEYAPKPSAAGYAYAP